MMLKRVLCVVMAFTMLLALTSCKSGDAEVKELTVTFNGMTISAPFTVEKLGSDYSVEYDSDIKIGKVLYKDKNLGLLVTFDENTAEYDYRKKNIKTLSGKNVSVNGVTYDSSKSEVKNAIGSPTETEKLEGGLWTELWSYCKGGKASGERYLLIMFDKNDKAFDLEVDLELL